MAAPLARTPLAAGLSLATADASLRTLGHAVRVSHDDGADTLRHR